ncbi:hypothetical protein [Brumimicrobium oceani]|uniref:Uncharacterized protein n=1 Tax=Brumimicrobium oceani TaxID=2100725 RepID=A0A2U2XEK3_9FLAO|nr:hypothetical protein [Brumimicrobium oceani]PWH86131.1 hypothetical protein DIT68_06135 [Brumimicrobium oceani]
MDLIAIILEANEVGDIKQQLDSYNDDNGLTKGKYLQIVLPMKRRLYSYLNLWCFQSVVVLVNLKAAEGITKFGVITDFT